MELTKDEDKSFYQVESGNIERQTSQQVPIWRERTSWLRIVGILLTGATMASILWSVGLFISPQNESTSQSAPLTIHSMDTSPAETPTRNCGSTTEEARMLGCQFQLWSYSWVPGECFDHQLQKDFIEIAISSEGWDYSTKPHGREEDHVDLGVVLGGGRDGLFTTWGQHYWHCVFYQRKFFAMMVGEDMDLEMMTNRDKDESHALSCQRWIADPWAYDWWDVNVNLTIGYHSC